MIVSDFHEHCRCGHTRTQHADRDNPLALEPLTKTEADDEPPELPTVLPEMGPGPVEGCGCLQFTASD